MFLFLNMGGGEIVVIFLFILMFFGAKSIPDIARTMGRAVRQFKDATQDIQRDIENSTREVKAKLNEESKQLSDTFNIDDEPKNPN